MARFWWNWGLARWHEQYKAFADKKRDKRPSGLALKKELNVIKRHKFPWMVEVTKYASAQPFIFLNRAWDDFLKKKKSTQSVLAVLALRKRESVLERKQQQRFNVQKSIQRACLVVNLK